ncbi:hypothetical protein L3K57_15765 (plasmid) [Enterococcus faecium]|uniref:hypothetical protein n=1 Tax=Enterococcus faecium TaxID=1352 RepID=UPI001F2434AB|nr:hypothetical protein [Enterococcus faecium]UJV65261.1 hypothetical protein L3K57_15765 [Enterococcus faecium]
MFWNKDDFINQPKRVITWISFSIADDLKKLVERKEQEKLIKNTFELGEKEVKNAMELNERAQGFRSAVRTVLVMFQKDE